MRTSTRRWCIPFQNARVESEGGKRSWINHGKIIHASRTTSYVFNSEVTELNLKKILCNVQKSLLINVLKSKCNILIRYGTPAFQINDDRQTSIESQHNFHIFLHDVDHLVELLMRASARRWCILF